MTALLKRAGSDDRAVAAQGRYELARALTPVLRQGVLKGDISSDVFEEEKLQPGVSAEYPLDFLTPGTEVDHVAYTVPAQGRIPERHVDGDYIVVPTYEYGSSIDFATKYARDARWNIVGRALEVLEGGVTRKKNSDAWRVLLAAGYNRFLTVYDDAAKPGYFTKRQVELMKIIMRRQAGGNSTSVNRGRLDRLYTSPEAMGDIRSWGVETLDPWTRRDIYDAEDLDRMKVFGTEIRSLDELGLGQEFQQYYLNTLGGSLPTYTYTGDNSSQTKLELVVGLDLSHDGVFMNPVRQEPTVEEDEGFKRQRRQSYYLYGENGWLCCDGRRVLVGAI
jgi:hypothetical protein